MDVKRSQSVQEEAVRKCMAASALCVVRAGLMKLLGVFSSHADVKTYDLIL